MAKLGSDAQIVGNCGIGWRRIWSKFRLSFCRLSRSPAGPYIITGFCFSPAVSFANTISSLLIVASVLSGIKRKKGNSRLRISSRFDNANIVPHPDYFAASISTSGHADWTLSWLHSFLC
jgi:hypothetical protein